MNTVYDTVLWLQSRTTAKRFPIVQFSGDTDMATDGWISLTSIDQPEVVVTQVTSDEYRAIAGGNDGYRQVECRVNAALGRTDLRCSWLVGIEEVEKTAQGASLPGFRTPFQPPRLLFRDIFEQGAVATETSRTRRSEFERNGGKLIVLQ
jgi:hypothetical protein